jgi:hypothetical protein
MMSDHLSSNKSGRCLTGMVSPRMSEHCGPKFGVTFSNKLQNDNMSVKSTKTGILKEINQNVPRLTHLLPKKTLHRGSDPRLHGSRELKPEFHHPEDFYDNRSGRGLDFAIKKRPKSSEICFNEVADLEALVSKKDDLVILIDENETEIEKIVDRLGIKKKGIRDEQNKLLRELEDLGLKLKDFDKPTGLNLRNCTVVSPYLTRCSQQALNKLRGVTENISNKETKDEISRAIKSILSERDDRESLVLSLLSLDTATLRERLSMLQEDLEGKSSEKAEVVGRMELLAADIAKLDLAIEHDKDYHERLGELQSLKHNAARNASNTSAELGKILIEKNSIESQIKALHLEIGEKVGRKNSINSEISKFVDELADSSCKALKEWLAEIKMISFDTYQIYSDFFSDLKEMEVAKQLDFDFQDSHTVAHSRELFVGLINLTGRVISMIGQSNAESALTSFRSDYLEVHTEVKVPAQVKNVVSTVVNSLGIFLPFKFNTEQPSIQIEDFIQKLKSYLTETSKNVDRYYDLLFSKMELSERIFQLMAEVKRKETAIFEFSRQQTQIVTSIPEMKTQTKNYNYQLALLLLHNPSSESFMEEPMRDTVDEADDELMSQITKKQEEVQPHQTKDQIRESKILENRLGEERNNKLSDDIKEICDNIRRVEHEQEYVIEKVKTYRRGLIEGLNKELKEFQCIASLFDYMSKPVLSREIGVSVMDSLLHDLASVVQQISSEISRQKRIIKLVNKNEDYSHEGRSWLTSREDLR